MTVSMMYVSRQRKGKSGVLTEMGVNPVNTYSGCESQFGPGLKDLNQFSPGKVSDLC